MVHHRQTTVLVLILLIAATLRFTGLDWDGYQHYHPDERYITWVATTIEAPATLDSGFAPHESTLNPFYWPPNASSEGIVVLQDQPRSFAYGHLPLYLGVLATRVAEWIAPPVRRLLPQEWALTRDLLNAGGYNEFHHLTAVSRALTALVDVGTVFLGFLLGRRVYGAAAGLLAAAFLAVNVMHVQLAHFFAVDPYLTFFTVAAIFAMVRGVEARSRQSFVRNLALAGVAIGLAVGSKFSAVLLFLPLIATLWLRKDADRASHSEGTGPRTTLLGVATLVVVVFVLTNPFAVLDWSCDVITPQIRIGPLTAPAMDLGSCFVDNVTRQSAMVRGDTSFDFTRQYVGTWPYVYPVLMQLRWGMGALLGVAAFAGFVWALVRGVRRLRQWRRTRASLGQAGNRGELILLTWSLAYFVVTGSFFAKFMRYMEPLTPFLMIYGAALLLQIPQIRWRRLAISAVMVGTALYALAFVNMYASEHPWNVASRWLYANATPGMRIANELWDDPLPSSMEVDGEFRSRHVYEYDELTWLAGINEQDSLQKLKLNLSRLAQADYVTLSSNRGYGVVSRLDDLYPLSHQYYELLFSGDLGFEAVFVTGRSPNLGDLNLWPDRFGGSRLALPEPVREFLASHSDLNLGKADESFTVYDQPMPIIFRNLEQLSVDEMLARFELP